MILVLSGYVGKVTPQSNEDKYRVLAGYTRAGATFTHAHRHTLRPPPPVTRIQTQIRCVRPSRRLCLQECESVLLDDASTSTEDVMRRLRLADGVVVPEPATGVARLECLYTHSTLPRVFRG